MIKKVSMILTIAAVVIGGGLIGIYQFSGSTASANPTEEEVLEKVKAQFPGEVTEFELEENGTTRVYEVEIEGTDRDYELVLNAETGEVSHLEEKEKKASAAASGNQTDDKADKQEVKTEASRTGDESDDGKEESVQSNNPVTPISSDKAREIAQKEVSGTIKELELDEDDGYLHYEIEMVTDQNEVDIDIDAYTGEILAVSYDDLDD